MKVSITYDDTLYQLVPKEPTQRMFIAYAKAFKGNFHPDHPRMAWSAMLSAAPTPPAQPAERMPLTEDMVQKIWEGLRATTAFDISEDGWLLKKQIAFVRAIEAIHGITAPKPQEPRA